ncbi:MAG TPA: hypothetical protein VIS48_14965 [Candidatus Kryptonia bacterium]
MKWLLSITVLALLVMSCSDSGTSPEPRNFNLKFSYGVNARNVLNTFENTYTKDLVMDGTTTAPFVLSDSELQLISAKMSEIGFFSYPDTFVVPTEDTVGYVTPNATYIFDVKDNSTVKHLYWSDAIISQDSAAVKLRELIQLIENIVESNPKYSQLPPARGGYL